MRRPASRSPLSLCRVPFDQVHAFSRRALRGPGLVRPLGKLSPPLTQNAGYSLVDW